MLYKFNIISHYFNLNNLCLFYLTKYDKKRDGIYIYIYILGTYIHTYTKRKILVN